LTDYEGFSKQDLIDRRDALDKEFEDNWKRNHEIDLEIHRINTILKIDKLAREGLREMGKDQLARNKLLEEKSWFAGDSVDGVEK